MLEATMLAGSVVLVLLGFFVAAMLSVRFRLRSLAALLGGQEATVRTFWLSSACAVEGRFGGLRAAVWKKSTFASDLRIALELETPLSPFEILRANWTTRALSRLLGARGRSQQIGSLLIAPFGEPEMCAHWLSRPETLAFIESLFERGRLSRLQSSGRWLTAHAGGWKDLPRTVEEVLEGLRKIPEAVPSRDPND